MNRPRRNRYRAGSLLLAVGLLAAVGALASLAAAKDGNRGHSSDRAEKRHHHGHHHHQPTGTIESFDAETGRLTISLFGGETVSGLVTKRTRIKCEDEHSPDISHRRHGEDEPGDDHGHHGDEPSDDHGHGDNSGSGHGPSGHDDNGTGANCTTSDLIPGTVVEEAELDLEHGKALFDEVELDD